MSRVPAPMNRARLLRSLGRRSPALLVVLAALAAPLSCSSLKDSEATVPSQRGAIQPDGGGALVPEASACSQLKAAESSARSALGCDGAARACPESIRPAGNDACYLYDQASIDGCIGLFKQFSSCEDFTLHPCLITVGSSCDMGEGGAGGVPNAPGEAGSAGSAGDGTGGTAGAAGALGSAGDTTPGAGAGGA